MERRIFIKNTCLACIGGGAASLLLQSCNSWHYVMSPIENSRLFIKKAEFTYLKKEKPMIRQWILVKNEKMPFPIAVFRHNENEYSATYLECSHQGCEVEPEGEHLQCPCHGSEFSNRGKLQHGPAEKDLKTFKVFNEEDAIQILLS